MKNLFRNQRWSIGECLFLCKSVFGRIVTIVSFLGVVEVNSYLLEKKCLGIVGLGRDGQRDCFGIRQTDSTFSIIGILGSSKQHTNMQSTYIVLN